MITVCSIGTVHGLTTPNASPIETSMYIVNILMADFSTFVPI